jgi:glucose/mannose transport system substrate-binding protein
MRKIAPVLAMLCFSAAAGAAAPRAEVIHWWISGGESAALKVIAAKYRAAGGVWIDTAVSGSEQARAVAVNRIIGGTPPAAAQFNTSKQYVDLIEEDMLSNMDDLARQGHWDATLPDPVRDVVKMNGHYFAVPVSLHTSNWFWYSKAAFKKAGIRKEPASVPELFAALDRLKAAGLIPLAHGGEGWQGTTVFMAMLANVGGKDVYIAALRDHDQRALRSERFREALLAFKRLHAYTDNASTGRSWNDTTALLLSGRAGIQIMGDWVKGEIIAAGLQPGKEIGCIAGLGPHAPLIIQGDAFLFPKSPRADVQQAQKLLASIMVDPATQVEFSRLKGSVPMLGDHRDTSALDPCTRTALHIIADKSRQLGHGETYMTAGQNAALNDVLDAYWKTEMPVAEAQARVAKALR